MKNKYNSRNWHMYFYVGLLFLFAFSFNTHAQEQSKLSFGARGGLASGSFTTINKVSIGSSQPGYQVGAFASFNIKSYLSVSLEVLFSNTGAVNIDPEYFYSAENDALKNPIINSSIITNQLSIPILISYNIVDAVDGVSPRVYLGGDYSFNMKTNSLNTSLNKFNGDIIYTNEFSDMGNRVASSDYGAIIGAGLDIGSEKIIYTFDLRYRIGLSDINETTSSYINSEIKRDVFSIMLGVTYKL